MEKPRAAGYIRVSTARQASEGLSLAEQRESIKKHCERQSWELIDLFEDAGVSGGQTSRPQLDRLLALLPSLDRIVVTRLDRLGRNAAGMLKLYETLDDAQVELHSLGDDMPTTGSAGRMMRTILAALAQWEAETLGERVAGTARQRANEGKHHGRAPFGYESQGGRLTPVEPEASIVRRVFEAAAAGTSQRQIARDLNAEGLRPGRAGSAHQGKSWTQSQISSMLRNPTYRGALRFGSEVLTGAHEPLVTEVLWDKARAINARNSRSNGGGRPPGPGRLPAGPHLFTRGLLRCGHCGFAMTPRTDRRERREEYRCLGREQNGPGSCPQKPIPRAPLDNAAYGYFREVALDLDGMRRHLADVAERRRAEIAAQLDGASKEERNANEAVERVRRDYTRGRITADEWHALKTDLERDHAVAQTRLAALRQREADVLAASADEKGAEDAVAARLASIQAAVAGEISGGRDLDAVRAALGRMFQAFAIFRAAERPKGVPDWALEIEEFTVEELTELFRAEGAEPFAVDGWIVLPLPIPEAITGLDERLRPVFTQDALQFANNEGLGLTT